MRRYLLLKPSEDGRPLSFLTPGQLWELLDDPETYAGIREFVTPDDVDGDPSYWIDGIGVLLRYEVIIPIPAGRYQLPTDDPEGGFLMCRGCYAGTYGAPIVNTDEVLVTAELIRRLYEDLGCPTGGPLHAMLDDMNIADDQVANEDIDKACAYLFDGSFERYSQAGEDTSDERKNAIKETCMLILHAFRGMPESHRAAAIAWHEGWAQELITELGPGGQRANAGEVSALVADWTREMSAPPPQSGGTKACVSVPCPPFTGQVSGTVYPGPGQVFAPDAKITGPGIVRSSVNSDGSASITWAPPPQGIDIARLFAAPGLVSMAPVMIDASGFTSGLVAFDPDYRIDLAPEPD